MRSKQLFLSLLIFSAVIHETDAQRWKLRRWEASAGLGTVLFYGDMGGTTATSLSSLRDYQMRYTRPSLNMSVSFKLRGDMSLRSNFAFGMIAGGDDNSRNENRQIGFKSTIFEPSLQFEYYLLSEGWNRRSSALFNRRGMLNNYDDYYLYVYAGLGGVFTNPKQYKDYRFILNNDQNIGLVIPAGIGIKYAIDSKVLLGFDFGPRLTFIDGMDGYSSPAYNKYKDFYYYTSFNAIYKIRSDRRGLPIIRGIRSFR